MIGFRNPTKRSAAYLVCALFFLLVAFAGMPYGAFVFYSIPALICVVQFLWPTLVGWVLVLLPVSIASGLLLFVLVRDLYWMSHGARPNALVDFGDSLGFLLAVIATVGLGVWLWCVRPQELKALGKVPKKSGSKRVH